MFVSHLVVNLHQLSASYISVRKSDLNLYVEARFTADINQHPSKYTDNVLFKNTEYLHCDLPKQVIYMLLLQLQLNFRRI